VVTERPRPGRRRPTRDLLALLADLERQLPGTRGAMRERTARAIAQVELELAPGRARERDVLNR
jgi:hypothetical protein